MKISFRGLTLRNKYLPALMSLLLFGITANAQHWVDIHNYQKIDGVWPFKVFIAPDDTSTNKVEGSVAFLDGKFFVKNSAAWIKVQQGSDTTIQVNTDSLIVVKNIRIPKTDTVHAIAKKASLIFDTTALNFYGYNGNYWVCLGCSGGGGSGTVTSIATNTGSGITGGTITGTGTLALDTGIIATRAWRDKLKDSLAAIIATKGNGTVTSVGLLSTDLRVSKSPIASSGYITADVKRKVYVGYADSAFFFGTSYTYGALSTNYTTTADKTWVKIVSTILGLKYVNYGTAGYKTNDIVNKYFTYAKATDVNVNLFYEGGANNVFRTWNVNNNASLEEVKGSLRTVLANQFLATVQAASALSTTGTWSNKSFSGGPVGGKANIQLSANVKQSGSVGATMTATISGDNVVIGTFNTDDIHTKGGRFTVTSDGNSIGSFSSFYKCSGRNDSLFNSTVDSLTNNVFFATGLGAGSHTIVITVDSVASGGKVFIDYVGTLASPNNCKPAFVSQMPWVDHGYETYVPAAGTYEKIDTAYQGVIAEFNNWPAYWIPTKDFIDSTNGINHTDGLHPNDLGHSQWASAVLSTLANNGNKPFPAALTIASTIINSGTDKGVLFNDNGVLNHDASYFTYNKTNHYLGIGTSSPTARLHIESGGGANTGINLKLTNSSSYGPPIDFNTPAGLLGQFTATGSGFNSGIFTGNQIILANYVNSGSLTIGTGGTSSYTNIFAGGLNTTDEIARFSTAGLTMYDGRNIVFNTTTGTKIGTGTTQKIAFYNSTPIVQPSGSVKTALSNLGLIGSPTIAESEIDFTDITTNNASTSKHGYLPKLDNNAAHYMDGTGAWSTPLTGITVQGQMGNISPAGNTTYYAGGITVVSGGTTANRNNISIPITGTIKAVYVTYSCGGTIGSSETSTVYLRVNNTTDYTISSSVTNDAAMTKFSNTGLSISVSANDFVELKWTTPSSYATPPTNVRLSFVVLIQ